MTSTTWTTLTKGLGTKGIAIGDGATYCSGSDRYPATVIRKTAKTVTIQSDFFKAAEGSNYYGTQLYTFSPNPMGEVQTARWSDKRQGWMSKGTRIHIGLRRAYQDPSF